MFATSNIEMVRQDVFLREILKQGEKTPITYVNTVGYGVSAALKQTETSFFFKNGKNACGKRGKYNK